MHVCACMSIREFFEYVCVGILEKDGCFWGSFRIVVIEDWCGRTCIYIFGSQATKVFFLVTFFVCCVCSLFVSLCVSAFVCV